MPPPSAFFDSSLPQSTTRRCFTSLPLFLLFFYFLVFLFSLTELKTLLPQLIAQRGFMGSAFARFGVPEVVGSHPGFLEDFEMMHIKCVGSYASSYMSTDFRTDLSIRRTQALKGLPSLVVVGEECTLAKELAIRVVNQLDPERGSGAVGVRGNMWFGQNYSTGGGALLKDPLVRNNVIQIFRLFTEAAS